MLVTVASEDGKSTQVEVVAETTVATIKSLAAAELGLGGAAAGGLAVLFNGTPLADSVTLGSAGVRDQDLLLVASRGGGAAAGAGASAATGAGARAGGARAPSLYDVNGLDPPGMLKFFKENPQLLRQLHHLDSKLAEALETGDVAKVRMCIMMQQMDSHKAKWTQEKERAALFANPDSEESQAKIARIIEQEAIDQNYSIAMEETPEVFARVMMLYIDTEINGQRVKAFVDSGAQSTIMSAACAERCSLMRLVDRRFHGEARGVGTGKIIGRIHMASIKIGQHHFPCSFTILENSDVDFLFGLDMLKRHQCVIDLKSGALTLGSAGTTVPFLSEKDLPSSARETQAENLGRKPSAESAARDEAAGGGSTAAGSSAAHDTPAPTAAGAAAAPRSQSPAQNPPMQSPSPSAGPTAHGSGGQGHAELAEGKVLQLVGMGFSRQQAESVLASTGGDVEQAAALLLAQMEM